MNFPDNEEWNITTEASAMREIPENSIVWVHVTRSGGGFGWILIENRTGKPVGFSETVFYDELEAFISGADKAVCFGFIPRDPRYL